MLRLDMYNANARNLAVPCVLVFQLFAFGLNRSAMMIPKNTAAPIPAAAAKALHKMVCKEIIVLITYTLSENHKNYIFR